MICGWNLVDSFLGDIKTNFFHSYHIFHIVQYIQLQIILETIWIKPDMKGGILKFWDYKDPNVPTKDKEEGEKSYKTAEQNR